MGNVVYGGCQWGILIVLAKLGSPEMVGQFSLGLAVVAPVIMLANLQLRAVQATDAKGEYLFGHYLGLRLITTALAVVVVVGVVAVAGYRLDRQDRAHRRLFGWLWTQWVNLLFGLDVRDVDCAFKLLRRRVLDGLHLECTGAMISTELFVKLRLRGARVCQMGVHHLPRHAGESSGGNPMVIIKAFRELVRFRRRIQPLMREVKP